MRSLRKNPPEFRYPEIVHLGAETHPFCIVFCASYECSKTLPNMFLGLIRKIACVHCEKIHPSFATMKQGIRVPKWTRFASFFMPYPDSQKRSKTCSTVLFGRLHGTVAKKSTRVSLPGNSAFGCRMHPFCIVFRAVIECSKTLPNMLQGLIRQIGCVYCEKIHPTFTTRKWCIRVPKCTRFASFFVL